VARPGQPGQARAAVYLAAAATGIAGTAVVAHGGGAGGPRLGFLVAAPLVLLALAPDLPAAAALTGAGTLGGGMLLLVREGRPPLFVMEWALLALAMTVVALVGARGFRRVWRSELQAKQVEAEALRMLGEAERKRAQAERLAVAARIAAAVAHEVNGPLAAVKSALQELAEAERSGERLPDAGEVIASALEGVACAAQKVGEMRSLAFDVPVRAEPIDLGAALEQAWQRASPRLAGVRAERSVGALPVVRGNPGLLIRSVEALLACAAQRALATMDPPRRWVAMSAQRHGGEVLILVEDAGTTLGDEAERRFFEPLAPHQGTGSGAFGISLVRDQVARCGGTVAAERRPEGGARFSIRLPVDQPEAVA
jgi:C4-dicarboxylate-specific signal transduction histidine kinase